MKRQGGKGGKVRMMGEVKMIGEKRTARMIGARYALS